MTYTKGFFALALGGLALAGCAGGRDATVRDLRTDHPRRQFAAILKVGSTGDRTMVGELIDLLESEDEGVRFAAAAGLHRLTGRNLGFHFATDQSERARIVEKWRRWWRQEGEAAYGQAPPETKPPAASDAPVQPPEEKTP